MIDDGANLRGATTTGPRPSVTPALVLSRAAIIVGWAMILSGLGLFGWDCLVWLRDGTGRQASLADLWGHAPLGGDHAPAGWAEMRGLHTILFRLLHWFGRFPISLALVLAGVATAWTANGVHEGAEEAAIRRLRRTGVR